MLLQYLAQVDALTTAGGCTRLIDAIIQATRCLEALKAEHPTLRRLHIVCLSDGDDLYVAYRMLAVSLWAVCFITVYVMTAQRCVGQ
jgi:hypothetical protein